MLYAGTSQRRSRSQPSGVNGSITMSRIPATALLAGLMLASSASLAQDSEPLPPQNARKLSEIVAQVEQRDGFRYVSEIDWNGDGYYDVTYFTADKAKVEIKIDAVTGKPR
jgi:hypothetical protein